MAESQAPVAAQHWALAWADVGLPGQGHELRDTLWDAYAQPQRRYHTQQHLSECLALWEALRPHAQHPGEVGLALWFHDAVYEVKASDNEARSADWARQALLAAGAEAAVAQRVHALVMATCHAAPTATADQALLVDIDLAILGADAARFAEYEQQVRDEYAWVPGFLYRRKRREVMRGFAQRMPLYQTAVVRARLEAQARVNLMRYMA
ncbi:N-methyl-D-aspartate receptor NMDAR2C subunit [Ideonella sp.]|jgi:predicted metal-dependent HD superfamily phosphohydrolase|uniref:N-methyl-D-aspartate receptor NMDAR2C subunit n=1 Tax=Ideonella sp. TaxID=1929293 RepID=UPI0037BE214F